MIRAKFPASGNKSIEQFQEKCEPVFRPELRKNKKVAGWMKVERT
ncbi:hypothetical protein ACVDG8_022965 [Mesorhizobium sp. ORM8.1]